MTTQLRAPKGFHLATAEDIRFQPLGALFWDDSERQWRQAPFGKKWIPGIQYACGDRVSDDKRNDVGKGQRIETEHA